jgi:uncharacterized protein (TIGR00725 family)
MRRRQVVVIGSHDATGFLKEAYLIGKHIGRRGWVLISGGRSGIMEAASRGAAGENGFVIGILPGPDDGQANPWCTAVIPTGIGFARNSINVLAADVIVAIGGGAGTLSELAYAWQYEKPVICCAFAGGWSATFHDMALAGQIKAPLYRAEGVDEACSLLDRMLLS